MKNKILFVGFAAFLILIIIICTEFLIGENFGKWFNTHSEASLYSSEQSGNVSIIRRGTGYILKKDVGLSGEDKIVTSLDSSVAVKKGHEFTVNLDENTQVSIEESKKVSTLFSAQKGTLYIRIQNVNSALFKLLLKEAEISSGSNTLFSAEVLDGTQTVNVYKGSVGLTLQNREYILDAGSSAVLLQDEDGKSSVYFVKTTTNMLSEFIIQNLSNEKKICFTREELNNSIQERKTETKAAQDAQQAHEAKVIARGGTVPIVSVEPVTSEVKDPKSDNPVGSVKNVSNNNKNREHVYTCTIEIRCDAILDNLEDLKEGKQKYVDENGTVLVTSKAEFIQGETVYNVLKRVCDSAKIPLEYRWTVEYSGYYIEGINNLFEFDCGFKSGWMYKVNGWYPNYGSSKYILKDGDVIVWNYTCNCGADLGVEIH